MELIYEQIPFWTKLEDVTEASKKPLPKGVIMQVKAKIGHAGRVTENTRLYRRSLLEREFTKAKERIDRRAMIGEADHPDPTRGGTPSILRSSLIFTGLKMEQDGSIMSSMDIPDTSAGRDVAALARADAEFGFSFRGTGTFKKTKMDEKDPDFVGNESWLGKEVEEVAEDYKFITADAVIGQASTDAVIMQFNENKNLKEEEMDFDIKKLTEDQWKSILDSEKVKKVLAEAVEVKTKELESQFEAEIKESVKEYMTSDEFAQKFEVIGEAAVPPQFAKGGKTCPECDAKVPAGAKYCPECGEKITEQATPDEKDKALKEMGDRLTTMETALKDKDAAIEGLKEREAEKLEQEKIEGIIAEVLSGKPKALVEAVIADLEDMDVSSENAKAILERKIQTIEAAVKASGGNLVPAGKGISMPGDAITEREEGGLKTDLLENLD